MNIHIYIHIYIEIHREKGEKEREGASEMLSASHGVLYSAAIEFCSRDTDNLWSRSRLADIPANKFPVGTAIFMGFVIRKPAVRKEAICSIADTISRTRRRERARKAGDALNASFRPTQTRVIRASVAFCANVRFPSANSRDHVCRHDFQTIPPLCG